MESQILLATDFRLERFVPWVVLSRELPEDSELLDSSVLLAASLFVLKLLDHDI